MVVFFQLFKLRNTKRPEFVLQLKLMERKKKVQNVIVSFEWCYYILNQEKHQKILKYWKVPVS